MHYPHENDLGFALEAVNKIIRIRNLFYCITICKNRQKIKMFNIYSLIRFFINGLTIGTMICAYSEKQGPTLQKRL